MFQVLQSFSPHPPCPEGSYHVVLEEDEHFLTLELTDVFMSSASQISPAPIWQGQPENHKSLTFVAIGLC